VSDDDRATRVRAVVDPGHDPLGWFAEGAEGCEHHDVRKGGVDGEGGIAAPLDQYLAVRLCSRSSLRPRLSPHRQAPPPLRETPGQTS
jgi:hypothetical protein